MDIDLEEDDLDLVEDRIKTFLLHKLQEIEVYNAKTRDTIATRKQSLKDVVVSQSTENNSSVAELSLKWMKIFDNKYVIGFNIDNRGEECLDEFSILLYWNSSLPLDYKTFIYNSFALPSTCNKSKCKLIWDLVEDSTIRETGYLVIVMGIPEFVDQTLYQIHGGVTCQRRNKIVNLTIPSIAISAADATNRAFFYEFEGNKENIMSVICCYESTELLFILSNERIRNLDSTFEIHCSLTKVMVPNSCKKYFTANRVSTLFDGSLLEIHIPSKAYPEILFCKVYARDEMSLIKLLHHIYQNIEYITIIPQSLQENYLVLRAKCSTSEETINLFKDSINKEIKLLQRFLIEQEITKSADKDTIIKFKLQLADLEKDTDLIYLYINNKK